MKTVLLVALLLTFSINNSYAGTERMLCMTGSDNAGDKLDRITWHCYPKSGAKQFDNIGMILKDGWKPLSVGTGNAASGDAVWLTTVGVIFEK